MHAAEHPAHMHPLTLCPHRGKILLVMTEASSLQFAAYVSLKWITPLLGAGELRSELLCDWGITVRMACCGSAERDAGIRQICKGDTGTEPWFAES